MKNHVFEIKEVRGIKASVRRTLADATNDLWTIPYSLFEAGVRKYRVRESVGRFIMLPILFYN